MKTSELVGDTLDWAVELALGTHWSPNGYFCHSATAFNRNPKHAYSIDWAQGGPICERELDGYSRLANGEFMAFKSRFPIAVQGWGKTPLIAAMRCFVASKLGTEIDVPKELL